MKSMIDCIWNDPVWSKVIASIIFAFLSGLAAIIFKKSRNKRKEHIETNEKRVPKVLINEFSEVTEETKGSKVTKITKTSKTTFILYLAFIGFIVSISISIFNIMKEIYSPIPIETETKLPTNSEPLQKDLEPLQKNKTKPNYNSIPNSKPPSDTIFVVGGKYYGETKNGKPHGMGMIHYDNRTLIDTRDPEKRYAEAGYTLIGEFYEGHLVYGKVYDENKNILDIIMIGRMHEQYEKDK